MKSARVRLMKQMKEDAPKWQQWKNQKNKEVMQLKAKVIKYKYDQSSKRYLNPALLNVTIVYFKIYQ